MKKEPVSSFRKQKHIQEEACNSIVVIAFFTLTITFTSSREIEDRIQRFFPPISSSTTVTFELQ